MPVELIVINPPDGNARHIVDPMYFSITLKGPNITWTVQFAEGDEFTLSVVATDEDGDEVYNTECEVEVD